MTTLVFENDQTLIIPDEFLKCSNMLTGIMEDTDTEGPISISEISYDVTKQLVDMVKEYQPHEKLCMDCQDDWLEAHVAYAEKLTKDFNYAEGQEKKLMTRPFEDLVSMSIAADYYGMSAAYIDVLCRAMAMYLKDLTPEEIRKKFNIPYDFTPEDEEKIKAEEEWIKKYGCK